MNLRISRSRQVTIPQELLDRCGLSADDEVDITAMARGLLIRKLPVERDPVEQVYGIWGKAGNTDDYMQAVRDS